MHDRDDDVLTPAERERFESLPREDLLRISETTWSSRLSNPGREPGAPDGPESR